MAGLKNIFSRVHQFIQSAAHDWKPPPKEHLTDNPIARQYETRTQAVAFLKAGKVPEFNAAQKSARSENPDYRLNLSIDDGLPDSRTAWANLIELVYGKHAATPENLAYAGNVHSWSVLFAAAHDKNIPLPAHLTDALQKRDAPAAPINLAWATISNADLAGADLRMADFSWTVGEATSFAGADLRGANFHNAVLTTADFTNARMEGMDLTGADLSQVKGLTAEKLAICKIDADTTLPDALTPSFRQTSEPSVVM